MIDDHQKAELGKSASTSATEKADRSASSSGITSSSLEGALEMSTLGGPPDYEGWHKVPVGADWSREFENFQSSAFRLETLQVYKAASETEVFARFRAGMEISGEWMDSWVDLIQRKAEVGATMSRVHIVALPLSEYLTFEIEHAYRYSLKAGEKIYVSDVSELSDGHALKEDFWLFDEATVVVNLYDRDGVMQGATINRDPGVVARYLLLQEEAMKRAEPVGSFYKRITGVDIEPSS